MQIIINVPPHTFGSVLAEEIGRRLADYFECELIEFEHQFLNGKNKSSTPAGLLSASELEGIA